MQRHLNIRKNMLQFTLQLHKTMVCGYAASKKCLSKTMLKETSNKTTQQSNQDDKATTAPNRFQFVNKLENGARIPTAVSCLIGRNQHPQRPRNEWQMATIEYSKSKDTLEQSARQLYKNAKLKPMVSAQRKSEIVSNSSVPQDISSSFFGGKNRNDGDGIKESTQNNNVQLSKMSVRLSKLFLDEPEPIYNTSDVPRSIQADNYHEEKKKDQKDPRNPQGASKIHHWHSSRKY